ncbi:hypothetical protein Tco_1214279 [Tanacetum coccineum]
MTKRSLGGGATWVGVGESLGDDEEVFLLELVFTLLPDLRTSLGVPSNSLQPFNFTVLSTVDFELLEVCIDEVQYAKEKLGVKFLSDYDCEIRYHLGKVNIVVRALSRKERVKPIHLRTMAMTIQSRVKRMINKWKVRKMVVVLYEPTMGSIVKKCKVINGGRGSCIKVNAETSKTFGFIATARDIRMEYWTDANMHVPLERIKVHKTLCFVEEPVKIIDREVKSLKPSRISIVKVCWNSKRGNVLTYDYDGLRDLDRGLEGYYRRFITNSSKVAKPLASLTQNNRKLEWAKEQKESFQTLKGNLLCTHAKRQGRERDSRNVAWPGPTNGKEGRWRYLVHSGADKTYYDLRDMYGGQKQAKKKHKAADNHMTCQTGNSVFTSFDLTAKTGYPMIERIQGQRSNPRGSCEEDLEASSPAINRRLLSFTKEISRSSFRE